MNTNLKKITALLSVCATLLVGSTAFAQFTDMPEGEVGKAMTAAVENGLLNGMSETEIGPDLNITRAQMGTILVRAMGASKTQDISGFVDMKPDMWHYDYMSKAVAMGAFKGDDQNRMNPDNNITFQEAFVVLSRIFDLADRKSDDTSDPFSGYTDASSVAEWAKADFGYILKYGYWKTEDGLLRPTDYITRAEFAVAMNNLVKTYVDEDDITGKQDVVIETMAKDGTLKTEKKTVNVVSGLPQGNVVIRIGDVIVKDYNDANGDIYISDGVDKKVSFENVTLNRIVARNGNVDFLSGTAVEIRMLTPGLNCYIAQGTNVKFFDGEGCTVDFGFVEM